VRCVHVGLCADTGSRCHAVAGVPSERSDAPDEAARTRKVCLEPLAPHGNVIEFYTATGRQILSRGRVVQRLQPYCHTGRKLPRCSVTLPNVAFVPQRILELSLGRPTCETRTGRAYNRRRVVTDSSAQFYFCRLDDDDDGRRRIAVQITALRCSSSTVRLICRASVTIDRPEVFSSMYCVFHRRVFLLFFERNPTRSSRCD
jgi:hypothetical protein